MSDFTFQLALKPASHDGDGPRLADAAARHLGLATGRVRSAAAYTVRYPLPEAQILDFAARCLADPVLHDVLRGLPKAGEIVGFQTYILVARRPGVTDDEGMSAQNALADFLNEPLDTHTQHIFSKRLYLLENDLPPADLRRIAEELLGNKLINWFETGRVADGIRDYTPQVAGGAEAITETVPLAGLTDEALLALSKKNVYALNLVEMRAIRTHYETPETQAARAAAGLPPEPTDCELEIIAQTWSEHCKHKEFAALIRYTDPATGAVQEIDGLFNTYIKGATAEVDKMLRANGNDWLVKVFSDNAGAVRINADSLFVWKVETHNSPSAIDPYGGAITGILGNNRDPLATGIGGAQLLFNTNVLCFGNPDYAGPLLTGQLHPRRILEGVRKGIEDGGNKSGVPTVNGAIVFDDRYAGKPLVYCGTGAVMPMQMAGRNSWEKPIAAHDRIVMAGGRVGKDGIHGATFSSIELDETAPATAVQIGSPITQKLAMDFLLLAARRGLLQCSTDNGAGGLSSSVGELAGISGGAVVELARVPLKYPGLRPWEIFVSESQERFTLVVAPGDMAELLALGAEMEVELTDIGCFTNDGVLAVDYDGQPVARLGLAFLHDGVPRKVLEAVGASLEVASLNEELRMRNEELASGPNSSFLIPHSSLSEAPSLSEATSLSEALHALLNSLNISSREAVIRQYDHEVKGRTIVKPLMGATGQAPQDAAVVRFNFERWEGVAVSNGIIPRYGDLDAYQMSAGAFDEAVRQIVAVGGRLPNLGFGDGNFWSVNDNFCVPDSVYDPITNPDGKEKLGKLVQMCRALYDACVAYCIPLTSGKDSMKNDFKADGVKISVPPTVLYSMTAKLADVRLAVTSDFQRAGDVVYLLGETYDELGASEYHGLQGLRGGQVPVVRFAAAKELYILVGEAHGQRLLQSCHDLSDGGLAVALAECCFGASLGADLALPETALTATAALFSESHSRFVASVGPEDARAFERILEGRATRLGLVTADGRLRVQRGGAVLLDEAVVALRRSWNTGPVNRLLGAEMPVSSSLLAQDVAPSVQKPARAVQNTPTAVHNPRPAVQNGGGGAARCGRALVLTGFGINCEEEMAAAYRLAGAEATVVHLNEVLHGRVSIHDFDVLNFPGGFSFGDDLGSGVVLANKLRYRRLDADGRTLLDDIRAFVAAGGFVLGICNGFQVLVKLGLLPNLGGTATPELTLTHNASGRYENRWVRLRVNPLSNTPFLRGIDTLEVPVRHGEGRLVLPDAATGAALAAAGLNCLAYVDTNGNATAEYPFNPNGADLSCAGLCDPTGRIFGLMPHPEAFLTVYNHPEWRRKLREGAGEEGAGLMIFRNIVTHLEHQVENALTPPKP